MKKINFIYFAFVFSFLFSHHAFSCLDLGTEIRLKDQPLADPPIKSLGVIRVQREKTESKPALDMMAIKIDMNDGSYELVGYDPVLNKIVNMDHLGQEQYLPAEKNSTALAIPSGNPRINFDFRTVKKTSILSKSGGSETSFQIDLTRVRGSSASKVDSDVKIRVKYDVSDENQVVGANQKPVKSSLSVEAVKNDSPLEGKFQRSYQIGVLPRGFSQATEPTQAIIGNKKELEYVGCNDVQEKNQNGLSGGESRRAPFENSLKIKNKAL